MELFRESFGLNLRLAHTVLTRRGKKMLAHAGFTLSEYMVLRSLGDQDGASILEISKMFQTPASQLNRAVKSLEKKGLVRKVTSRSDKRVNHIFLTRAGKKSLKQLIELRNRFIGDLSLTSEEVKMFRRLTEKIFASDEQS